MVGTFTVFCYGTGEGKVIGIFDLQLKHYLGIIMGFYYKLTNRCLLGAVGVFWEWERRRSQWREMVDIR